MKYNAIWKDVIDKNKESSVDNYSKNYFRIVSSLELVKVGVIKESDSVTELLGFKYGDIAFDIHRKELIEVRNIVSDWELISIPVHLNKEEKLHFVSLLEDLNILFEKF